MDSAQNYRLVAIFGGTFNPVHNGHIRSALELKQRLSIDHVYMVPAAMPPLRELPEVAAKERLQMLKLAVANEPELEIDERELAREGISYSVDTLAEYRAELSAQQALVMVIGSDAFLKLHQWHQWQRILELAHIVVIHRPGWSVDTQKLAPELGQILKHHLGTSPEELSNRRNGVVWFEALTPIDISATLIRNAVAKGESISRFVPESVAEYIRCHGLYRKKSEINEE